ncbi:MAG: leucine-rich repeat domain-containing protein [Clostridiales bacterium]|nr:leucine-rich repeat domain-containing protein [Clostridiales bacterium]
MLNIKKTITGILMAAVVIGQCAAPGITTFAGTEETGGEALSVDENATKVLSSSATSGTCGENLTWTLNDGTLTISGTGDMTDYSYDSYDGPVSDWQRNYEITSVVIEDGVTSIGDYAFYYCNSLTSVMIPDSVTSIGHNAFFSCSRLTSVTIPDSVISIGVDAFAYCNSLTSVTIPDGVSIGSYAFSDCSSLTSVTIPDGASIGDCAFSDCSSLTSVTISDGVTDIGNSAFEHCSNLTKFIVSPGNASYSADGGILYSADKTTLVCYPSASGSVAISDSVTKVGDWAFYCCESLTSVTIPDSVTSIGYGAFYACSLADVYYAGSESDWNAISIGSYNSPLTGATIHYNSTGPDIGTGSEFTSGSATYQVTSTAKNTVKFVSYSGSASKATIPATVTYGGTKYKVTAIAARAFSGNKTITSVTIGKNVKKIGAKAFKGCKKIKTVKVNSTKLSSVGKNAFKGISGSAKIKVPSANKSAYKKLLAASGYTGTVKTI